MLLGQEKQRWAQFHVRQSRLDLFEGRSAVLTWLVIIKAVGLHTACKLLLWRFAGAGTFSISLDNVAELLKLHRICVVTTVCRHLIDI